MPSLKAFFSRLRYPKQISQAWIFLSITALILAGFLSMFIMLGRTPLINEWMFGPHWMRRVLVVHVNLALTVSFYSFITGLFLLIPVPGKHTSRRLRFSFLLAILSTFILTISGFIPAGEPILSNYVPVINHPIFIAGICLFAFSVILTLFDKRLLVFIDNSSESAPSAFPTSVVPSLQAAGLILIISMFIFFQAWLVISPDFSSHTYFEFVLWGGGHVLQFANMAAAASVWGLLYFIITGKHILSYRGTFILFGLYTLPLFLTPFLLIEGTTGPLYISGFTHYMQWGIFPIITIFIGVIATKVIRHRESFPLHKFLSNPSHAGLALSIFLTIAGFILGSMIRGSNTMVPAHYHATLGAVTIAFMTAAYWLMSYYGYPDPSQKQKRQEAVQLLIYGTGQTIFVSGLAVAGVYGLARKVFGEEQLILTPEIYIGLALLLIGGLTAITGGILFLRNILRYLRNNA